jgi:hypothetical protein
MNNSAARRREKSTRRKMKQNAETSDRKGEAFGKREETLAPRSAPKMIPDNPKGHVIAPTPIMHTLVIQNARPQTTYVAPKPEGMLTDEQKFDSDETRMGDGGKCRAPKHHA